MPGPETLTYTPPEAPDPRYPLLEMYPQAVRWNSPVRVGALHDMVDDAAERFGQRPAIDFLGKRYTYAEMKGQVDRVARGLQDLGYGPGSRIGLFLPNCPYYPFAYYGALKAGCTVVNFNPLYSERELRFQAEDSGIEVMVTLDVRDLFDKLQRVRAQVPTIARVIVGAMGDILPPTKRVLFSVARRRDLADVPDSSDILRFRTLVANGAAPDPVAVDIFKTPALLQYTGGTTGTPKGAVLTHSNLRSCTEQALLWCTDADLHAGQERLLSVLPFFHIFGVVISLNIAVILAGENVMLPRFEIGQVLKAIEQHKVTVFPGVPSIYAAINNNRKTDRYDLSSLKLCVSGGAPLPREVKQHFEALAKCHLIEGYGLTETSGITHANPLTGLNKEACIGLVLPGTEMRIVDIEDPAKTLGPGERGELCVKGPQIMQGYHNRDEENRDAFVDGFFRTGDIAVVDDDGYTSIVDRKKDLIIVAGFNVYPRNVEQALYSHPAVEECVVAGLPDGMRGEIVKAWVKLKDGQTVSAADLRGHAGGHLAGHEVPREIEIRAEALPKTLVGKLSRKALRDEALAALGKSAA